MAHEEQPRETRQSQSSAQAQGGQQQQSGQPRPHSGHEPPQSQQAPGGGRRGRASVRPLRIQEHGRQAYHEAQQLASTLEQAVDEIGQFLRDQAEQRPYVSLATAAGIGYVLGGGVPSRLTGFLFGLGSRFAIEMFLRELVGDTARLRAAAATTAAK